MNIKKIRKYYFPTITILMLFMFVVGIFGFFIAPAKAKANAEAIEEMLRKNQEEEAARKSQTPTPTPTPTPAEDNAEIQEEDNTNTYTDASEMRIIGIGDSVMLAALPQLYNTFPNGYFDAVFGRTIYEGMNVLQELADNNNLGDAIVFSLGTNSYIQKEDCLKLIEMVGDIPTFWITTYGVANDSNEIMASVVAENENAYTIDWETLALEHRSEYILSDALHPSEAGSIAYANYIKEVINEKLITEVKKDKINASE